VIKLRRGFAGPPDKRHERIVNAQITLVLVTLSSGDVAAMARAVADRIDPSLDVRIEPADPVDPYRWEKAAWIVHAGTARSYVVASMTAEQAIAKLQRDLTPGD
jgi:hypothetical protein